MAVHNLEARWEMIRFYRDWAEKNLVEAHQSDPDFFWSVFHADFERGGFTREQVDKVMERQHKVEPS